MKKTFISIAGLTILTLFIIVTVYAQSNDPKASKANTAEIKKDVSDDAVISVCPGMAGKKIAGCCSGGCSAMNCDAAKCQGGKCDPVACKGGNCDQANCTNGKCGQTAQRSNCRSIKGMMSGPMNCARDLTVAVK